MKNIQICCAILALSSASMTIWVLYTNKFSIECSGLELQNIIMFVSLTSLFVSIFLESKKYWRNPLFLHQIVCLSFMVYFFSMVRIVLYMMMNIPHSSECVTKELLLVDKVMSIIFFISAIVIVIGVAIYTTCIRDYSSAENDQIN